MTIIRVGVIGYGYIAEIHINNILKFPNVKITSIFSRTNKEVQFLKNISFYTNYKEMIKKEELDAVIIATPTHTHKEIACYCAEQGLNIFLEKPMARNLEECNSIIDSIKEYKIKLFIGHVLRFWPTYGSVKDYLTNSGSIIGDIESITLKRIGTFPWSKWFADQAKSGGVILDLSIHDIDYSLWILDRAVSVKCEANKLFKYGMNVFAESFTKLNFESNKIAKCEASWAKPADFQFYTYGQIKSSKDIIEFDGNKIYNNDVWNIKNIFASNDGYYNEMKHFFDVIRDRNKKFLISESDGREAVKVCLAAIKSAENYGKEIYLDDLE